MRSILSVVDLALQFYIYIVFAMAIMSWLLSFNIINFNNEFVRSVWRFLVAVTEPVLKPIRNILPNLGGVDISPIILLFIIYFIRDALSRYVYPNVF